MPIFCRHVEVFGRLSIDGFSFERVAQFNLEWIFSKLDSGFFALILDSNAQYSGFHKQKIPGFRNPDSLSRRDVFRNRKEYSCTWHFFNNRHLAVDCKTGEIVFETHFSK